jgi:hypothetical protein
MTAYIAISFGCGDLPPRAFVNIVSASHFIIAWNHE